MPNTPRRLAVGISDRIISNVRAELGRHDKTYGDLAAFLEKSSKAVTARMNGTVDFKAVELAAIATWLGVPLTALLPPAEEEAS